jgi:hypothetical protein
MRSSSRRVQDDILNGLVSPSVFGEEICGEQAYSIVRWVWVQEEESPSG